MNNPSSYLKMRVLGAIEFAEGKTLRERIKAVSEQAFEDENGRPRRFTWRTIETWLMRYRKHGVTAMNSKPRSDRGACRKITHEHLVEAIEQVLPAFRGKSYNKAQIYRACVERGLLRREQIAPNTFRRLVSQYELLKPHTQTTDKRRLAFSKPFANDMWQADTMYGPHVNDGKRAVQTKLIAFIDDASRVLCHGQFFFHENTEALITAWKSALYKRGVPRQIYVDNGSIYTCKEMIVLCARLGCILSHAPLRDGAAKGKIERFFRTVRQNFLTRELDLSGLEALNRQFIAYAEDEYNARTHSTLRMRPIGRFGLDLNRILFLPPNQANEELFYVEENRRVKNDNTFSLNNVRFEAPCDLRNRTIQVRFDRRRAGAQRAAHVIVHYKDQRIGQARPVDFVANDRPPKAKGDRQ